jgi:hypothetical protein
MEHDNPLGALQRWHEGLSLALTPLQKAYCHLLIHRLYDISTKTELAQQELRAALTLLPDCAEAKYRQTALLIKDSKEVQGLAQLQKLIEQDRRVYLKVLFEPAFAACQRVIYYFLSSLVHAARAEATAQMVEVIEETNGLRQWYPHQEAGLAVFERALARMRHQVQSGSYFGYQDASYEGGIVLERMRKLLPQRKAYVQHEFETLFAALRHQLESLAGAPIWPRRREVLEHVASLQARLTRLREVAVLDTPAEFWSSWRELQKLKVTTQQLARQHATAKGTARERGLLRVLRGLPQRMGYKGRDSTKSEGRVGEC